MPANRLSADGPRRVLRPEAGLRGHWLTRMPVVHRGLLVAIVVVVVSGYLLPWSLGREPDVFGLDIPSPMGANRDVHEFVERVHDVSGHLFIPLLALHVLGAVKHPVFDWRRAGLRMFRPIDGGR